MAGASYSDGSVSQGVVATEPVSKPERRAGMFRFDGAALPLPLQIAERKG